LGVAFLVPAAKLLILASSLLMEARRWDLASASF